VQKKLTLKQKLIIQKEITDKNPSEVGLNGHSWGRAEVCELIKRRYGIEMPLSTMGDYLVRWKFTHQRQKKDYRQDEKAVKEWLEVTYPNIVEKQNKKTLRYGG